MARSGWASPFITFHDPLAAATIFRPDLCTYQQGSYVDKADKPARTISGRVDQVTASGRDEYVDVSNISITSSKWLTMRIVMDEIVKQVFRGLWMGIRHSFQKK
jgi:hypothetical protein